MPEPWNLAATLRRAARGALKGAGDCMCCLGNPLDDRPILFSGEAVRAILDGRKTQTRRVVKLPHAVDAGTIWQANGLWWTPCVDQLGRGMLDVVGDSIRCPYGVPGDRLWVRETWQYAGCPSSVQSFVGYRADGAVRFCEGPSGEALVDVWAALSEPSNYAIDGKAADRRWRPSIHMPRWASRITLHVTAVRVQRLQDISEEDARAEGVDWAGPQAYGVTWDDSDREDPREVGYPVGGSFARDNFGRLWNTLAKPGSHWADNPWVWAITFTRTTEGRTDDI